jgi:thiol-disulfide isomerase/thioredoxin
MDILTRAFVALLIFLASLSIYFIYNTTLRRRSPNLLAELQPNRPFAFTLVYFTTPSCVPCKTIQKPAIQSLSQLLGNGLHVIEIDASEKTDLASRWGVMSVPTTFIFDPKGNLLHINHGVTRTETLLKQIRQ